MANSLVELFKLIRKSGTFASEFRKLICFAQHGNSLLRLCERHFCNTEQRQLGGDYSEGLGRSARKQHYSKRFMQYREVQASKR